MLSPCRMAAVLSSIFINRMSGSSSRPGRPDLARTVPRSRARRRTTLGHRRDRRPDRCHREWPTGPRRAGEGLPARPAPVRLPPRRLRPDPARQGQRHHPLRRRLRRPTSSSSAAASPTTPRSGCRTRRWSTGARWWRRMSAGQRQLASAPRVSRRPRLLRTIESMVGASSPIRLNRCSWKSASNCWYSSYSSSGPAALFRVVASS